MKPPTRSTRSLRPKKKANVSSDEENQNSDEKWSNGELRSIASGLRLQLISRLEDIDISALQTRVPKRSVQEVELLLKSVKHSVARKVYYQVKKQRKEEQQQKVPIEVWAELMERVAGKHEEKISSAFSRMLVVAGTEPCSLQHSSPPRNPENSSGTMSVRTISRVSTGSKSLNTDAQISSNPNAQELSGKEDVTTPDMSCLDKNKHLPPLSSGMSTEAAVSSGSSALTSAMQSPSVAQHAQPVTQNRSATSAASSSSLQSQQSQSNQGGNSSQNCPSQSSKLETAVDFEKIYAFLSTACKYAVSLAQFDSEASLTAMECAVVLDLIMSLPEELPHMDCESLQEHFLKVYSQLTTPVNLPLKTQGPAQTNEAVQASPVRNLTRVDPTWENKGICPLNPLMVPLSLLARKKDSQS